MAFSTQHTTGIHEVEQLFQPQKSKNHVFGADSQFYYYGKRAMDLTLVMLALPTLLPLFLIIALCIKLDSKGSVFYRQERVGSKPMIRNGKVTWETVNFSIFKFRSMYSDTNDAIHQEHVRAWINGELGDDESGAAAKVKNDPRITRVGHFIRKTSIDELPQMINIVLGEMSIVGPRPVPEYEVAQYRPQDYVRLQALPGLTGLWQVEGRGNVSFEEMMELDTKYIKTRSLWKDLTLIVRTVPAVLLGRGAE